MTAKKKKKKRAEKTRNEDRGRAFVELGGEVYVNLAFDLPPLDPDPREDVAEVVKMDVRPGDLLVLRRLEARDREVVLERLDDAAVEAWSALTATIRDRR